MNETSYIKKYFDNNTWLRKENANQTASYSQMKGFVAGEAIKAYTLAKYPPEIRKLHDDAYIHIHDLSNGDLPYCCGIDFYQLLNMGLITDRIVSKPAKHLDTALNQAVNMICTNQQEWCYDDITEVLTLDGWKLFKNTTPEDKIMTLNPESRYIEYQNPEEILIFPYEKRKMIHFKNESVDLMVTQDHNIPVESRWNKKIYFKKAKDLLYQETPTTGIWTGENPEFKIFKSFTYENCSGKHTVDSKKYNFEDWAEFMGFWISEGWIDSNPDSHHYRIGIAQTQKENQDIIKKLLIKMNINYSLEREKQFIFHSKQLWEYLKQFGKSYDKFIPDDIKNASKDIINIFIDAFFIGDGSQVGSNREFYSMSERLIDDIQELLIKGGKYGRKYKKKINNKLGPGYIWTVREKTGKYNSFGRSKTTVEYTGHVYCLTIPNHIMYVRRNGISCWSGNSGAQALNDFNTLLAPFVAKDHLSYLEVKQAMQRFIFDLNYPSRSAFETPFSNVMMNTKCPKTYEEEAPPFLKDYTYSDYHDEAFLILEAFNDVLIEGDGKGNPFTFPLPTINVLESTNFSEDLWYKVGQTEAKYGSFYFMNFDGSGIDPNSVRALCCRLSLDLKELPSAGGRWAFQGSTGSVGVCTLNMGKLGYLSKDDDDFFAHLDYVLEQSKKALLLKDEWSNALLKQGYLPLSKIYGVSFDRFFRTIGIVGLHELTLNFLGEPIWKSAKFVAKVLNYIRNWTKETQIETGKLWNMEQTPAEGCATRFGFRDREMHPGIFTQGTKEAPYYTSMLTPPSEFLSFFDRLATEEKLLPLFTGGTVFRMYVGEKRPDPDAIIKLIKRMAKNTKIPYFDISPTYSICNKCGTYSSGSKYVCSKCGAETFVYDRVVGYYRPRQWVNVGKLKEIESRLSYDIF